MSAPLNLSVVVPLYNEEESLPHLVEQLLSALRPSDEAFELVLVDDGSSDHTANVLAKLSAEVPEVGLCCCARTMARPQPWRLGLMWLVER